MEINHNLGHSDKRVFQKTYLKSETVRVCLKNRKYLSKKNRNSPLLYLKIVKLSSSLTESDCFYLYCCYILHYPYYNQIITLRI